MIPLKVIGQHRQQADRAVLDLPRLGEHLPGRIDVGGVVPIQLSDDLEDLVDGFLG